MRGVHLALSSDPVFRQRRAPPPAASPPPLPRERERKNVQHSHREISGREKKRGAMSDPRLRLPNVSLVMIQLFLLRGLLSSLLRSFLLRSHPAHHLSCRTGPHGRAYLA